MSQEQADRFVILVAADTTESSTEVVRVASRMAKSIERAELHVIHILTPTIDPSLGAQIPTVKTPVDLLDHARVHLESLGKNACTQFVGRVIQHLSMGDPEREILQLAENLRADLIVVGSHNYTGLRRLALGSVSEHVVRKASCPVLVVRPKNYPTSDVPNIEPACADCLATQKETHGEKLWCQRHSEHHPKAHTYYETPESFARGSSLLRP